MYMFKLKTNDVHDHLYIATHWKQCIVGSVYISCVVMCMQHVHMI